MLLPFVWAIQAAPKTLAALKEDTAVREAAQNADDIGAAATSSAVETDTKVG